MLAIGVLMSSLTQYQLVAAMLGVGALVTLWIVDFFATQVGNLFIGGGNVLADILSNISIIEHFRPTLLRGFLNVTDIAFSLFLATRVLETRRWRA